MARFNTLHYANDKTQKQIDDGRNLDIDHFLLHFYRSRSNDLGELLSAALLGARPIKQLAADAGRYGSNRDR